MGLADIGTAAQDASELRAVRGHIRRKVLVWYVTMGLVLAVAEAILNFVEGRPFLGISLTCYGVMLVGCAMLIDKHPSRAEFVGVLATFLLLLVGLVYIFESGVISYLSWSFIFIPVAFALQGVEHAVKWTLALLGFAGLFYVLYPGESPLEPVMAREWSISYLAVFALALLFQFVRQYYEGLVASLNVRLETLATTDQLTQAYNRRMMETLLSNELERQGGEHGVSVILFDLDHFKLINDTHGHLVGDTVLRVVADLSRERVRGNDYFGRWGGEEFLILSAGTAIDAAAEIAERLRSALADHPFDNGMQVTASFGVSSLVPSDDLDGLIRRADDALYEAKARGRNCVVVAPLPTTQAKEGALKSNDG